MRVIFIKKALEKNIFFQYINHCERIKLMGLLIYFTASKLKKFKKNLLVNLRSCILFKKTPLFSFLFVSIYTGTPYLNPHPFEQSLQNFIFSSEVISCQYSSWELFTRIILSYTPSESSLSIF